MSCEMNCIFLLCEVEKQKGILSCVQSIKVASAVSDSGYSKLKDRSFALLKLISELH